jgi:hypothetical protein
MENSEITVMDYFGTLRWQMVNPVWVDQGFLPEGFTPEMVDWTAKNDVSGMCRVEARGQSLEDNREALHLTMSKALLFYIEDVSVLFACYTSLWEDEGVEIKQPFLMMQISSPDAKGERQMRIKPSIILDSPTSGYRKKVQVWVRDKSETPIYQWLEKGDVCLTESFAIALKFINS